MPSWNLLTSQKGGKTRQTEKAEERKMGEKERKRSEGKTRGRGTGRGVQSTSQNLYRDPGANIPDGIFPEAGGALICIASHHLGC